jgi:hypothetical protein
MRAKTYRNTDRNRTETVVPKPYKEIRSSPLWELGMSRGGAAGDEVACLCLVRGDPLFVRDRAGIFSIALLYRCRSGSNGERLGRTSVLYNKLREYCDCLVPRPHLRTRTLIPPRLDKAG